MRVRKCENVTIGTCNPAATCISPVSLQRKKVHRSINAAVVIKEVWTICPQLFMPALIFLIERQFICSAKRSIEALCRSLSQRPIDEYFSGAHRRRSWFLNSADPAWNPTRNEFSEMPFCWSHSCADFRSSCVHWMFSGETSSAGATGSSLTSSMFSMTCAKSRFLWLVCCWGNTAMQNCNGCIHAQAQFAPIKKLMILYSHRWPDKRWCLHHTVFRRERIKRREDRIGAWRKSRR